jgi:hypothetical protein
MTWTLVTVLAVDVVVLAGFWLLARRWLARRLSAPRQAADLGEEVGRLVTELNQVAERNVVLLEDRVSALNELLAAADKKIGLLRREMERHEAGALVYGRLATPAARAAAARDAEAGSKSERATAGGAPQGSRGPMADGGGKPSDADTTTADAAAKAVMTTAGTPVSPSAATSGGADARTAMRAEIGRLARAGLAAAAIAVRVGAPLGEVELILSLEQRARGS